MGLGIEVEPGGGCDLMGGTGQSRKWHGDDEST